MYKTDTKNEAKRLKATFFAIPKFGIVITKWGAIEKSKQFDRAPKIISHFGGTKIFFVDCSFVKLSVTVISTESLKVH